MTAVNPVKSAPAAGSAPILSLNNIEVVYDRVILVLKGVSLAVPDRGIVALLGANGAGKTTTLKAISNSFIPNEARSPKGLSCLTAPRCRHSRPTKSFGGAAFR